jgi:Fic family protein
MFPQRFHQILPGIRTNSAARANLQNVCRYAIKSRVDLLNSIYRPAFANLKKSSPEYVDLARSGRVWENFFKPGNIEPYLQAQSDLNQTLASVDELKEWYQENDKAKTTILRALVPELAHQSTSLEQNPLHIGDSVVIFDKLEKQLFCNIDSLSDMSISEVSKLALPTSEELLLGKSVSEVAELRNHILVSRYITEAALKNLGTAGMSVADIKQLSMMILRGTDAETLCALSWGKRIQIGECRSAPISVKSNLMRIFPYPQEISACMHRYVEWRDRQHTDRILHPIILATHLSTYFVHIHPFLDGNGRLGRVLMADYLIRQGYLPVVFVDLPREDYLKMISDAQDGKPDDLCATVAQTQLEMLGEISMRR